MKININIVKKFFFYIGFYLMQFAIFAKNVSFVNENMSNLIKISIVSLFICAVLTLICKKTTRKQWVVFAFLIFLSIASYAFTGDNLVYLLVISIIAASDLDFNKIIKSDILYKILLFAFIYYEYKTGNVIKDFFIRKGEIRYALGFNHPNTLGYYFLLVYLEYTYLKSVNVIKKKNIIFEIIQYITINSLILFMMNLAHSRTSQLCLIIYNVIYILALLYNKLKRNKNKKEKGIDVIILYIVLTAVSLFVSYKFVNTGYLRELNDLFSNRLAIQHKFLNLYQIPILGQKIDYFVTLDNAYLHILLNYGIISWLAYGIVFYRMIINSKGNIVLKVIIILLMIYGIMEWYMLRPLLNTFLFCFSLKQVGSRELKDEKTEDINCNTNI